METTLCKSLRRLWDKCVCIIIVESSCKCTLKGLKIIALMIRVLGLVSFIAV